MPTLEEICLLKVFSSITQSKRLVTEKNIQELESFRHHLRITSSLEKYESLWNDIKRHSHLSNFDLWTLFQNKDCTEMELLEILPTSEQLKGAEGLGYFEARFLVRKFKTFLAAGVNISILCANQDLRTF